MEPGADGYDIQTRGFDVLARLNSLVFSNANRLLVYPDLYSTVSASNRMSVVVGYGDVEGSRKDKNRYKGSGEG